MRSAGRNKNGRQVPPNLPPKASCQVRQLSQSWIKALHDKLFHRVQVRPVSPRRGTRRSCDLPPRLEVCTPLSHDPTTYTCLTSAALAPLLLARRSSFGPVAGAVLICAEVQFAEKPRARSAGTMR